MATFTGMNGFVELEAVPLAKRSTVGFFSFRTKASTGLFLHQASMSLVSQI